MPHSHDHGQNHADNWTNIAAAGEMVASFLSDSYWLGGLLDLATGLPEEALGLSYWGIGVGTVAALLSAGGAAYAHWMLNTVHQAADHTVSDEELPVAAAAKDENSNPLVPKVQLTGKQKLALTGDYISHVGDIAGPITFVANLATKNGLPRWGKALIQCGATLYGGLASVANVRTCRDAMLKANKLRLS